MMRRISLIALPMLIVLGGRLNAAGPTSAPAASQPVDDAAMGVRSLVDRGDTTSLERVFAKARRGEPVTVAVIGGSVTQGAWASAPERRYGNLVAAWWRQQFAKSQITFINAGKGATSSNYGALRVERDLIQHRPDFVVIEFAVNDANTRERAESLEGLIRQLLRGPEPPAVCLLFMMHQKKENAQEWQSKIGRHYGLPMISFRDALRPEIETGRLKWEDVEKDAVHPNDRGHAYAARFITDFLEDALRAMPAESRPASSPRQLPPPLISDLFEHVTLLEADALKPVANQGWTYTASEQCWKANKPGSVIEFEVQGSVILIMHYVLRGPMGRASVSVDGGPTKELEGWFNGTWGGYRQTTEIARGLPAGKHRVRIELLLDKHAESTGTEFRILGLGTAGL